MERKWPWKERPTLCSRCHATRKLLFFKLPTWAILGRCECQKRFNLEGKGYGLKFPDFFQNVVIVNTHLKLWLAEPINHSYGSLCVTRTFAVALGRLFFSTPKKKKRSHKKTLLLFNNYFNSLSQASMDHCLFLDCASLWEKT